VPAAKLFPFAGDDRVGTAGAAAVTVKLPVSIVLLAPAVSYAVADQLTVCAVENVFVKVVLAELPLTVLRITAEPSFQFRSTYDKFPSTSAAASVIVYDCPAVMLVPVVLVFVKVGEWFTAPLTLKLQQLE
jgi:cobalamin synthase